MIMTPKFIVWKTTTYEQEQTVVAYSETDAIEQAKLHNEWLAPLEQNEDYQVQWIGNEYYE
jgi:hypothetical protein